MGHFNIQTFLHVTFKGITSFRSVKSIVSKHSTRKKITVLLVDDVSKRVICNFTTLLYYVVNIWSFMNQRHLLEFKIIYFFTSESFLSMVVRNMRALNCTMHFLKIQSMKLLNVDMQINRTQCFTRTCKRYV